MTEFQTIINNARYASYTKDYGKISTIHVTYANRTNAPTVESIPEFTDSKVWIIAGCTLTPNGPYGKNIITAFDNYGNMYTKDTVFLMADHGWGPILTGRGLRDIVPSALPDESCRYPLSDELIDIVKGLLSPSSNIDSKIVDLLQFAAKEAYTNSLLRRRIEELEAATVPKPVTAFEDLLGLHTVEINTAEPGPEINTAEPGSPICLHIEEIGDGREYRSKKLGKTIPSTTKPSNTLGKPPGYPNGWPCGYAPMYPPPS